MYLLIVKQLNVIKKYLTETPFEVNGNLIKFLKVSLGSSIHGHPAVNLLVDVETKDNISYVEDKFHLDVQDILNSISDHLGGFSASYDLLINGKHGPNIFITNHKKRELQSNLQNFFTGTFDLMIFENSILSSKISPKFYPNSQSFYDTNMPDIRFSFVLNYYDFEINGEPVKIKPIFFNSFACTINDKIIDDDELRSDLEGIVIQTLEPEFEIGNTELYYVVNCWLGTLDGKSWKEGYSVLTREQIFSLVFY